MGYPHVKFKNVENLDNVMKLQKNATYCLQTQQAFVL